MTNNRKPAHLEYAGGKSPRQLIWEQLRHSRNGITLPALVGALPGTIHRDTTRTYVKSLLAGQYLELDDFGLYKLIKDNGVEAPRVRRDGSEVTLGREQENVWRSLRAVNHPVNYRELAALASTATHPVTPAFAKDYLANLYKAGYVTRNDSKPFKGACKYQLIPSKNTGPRPPMIQRIKQVYDPNLGKVVWSETKGDGDA
ncbi:hypothetical protein [Methylomonas sp. ZR1]|uniref:hypothetical protein n=1 Tax=Methylomonas sp. ZR1 TaxID=1797072 RepID=UPI00149272E9|nr:hypothetical protein [Methylomonas sp. ZR1]NOV29205.1 hypothetical protein [Methylomonas sp. ZR1]